MKTIPAITISILCICVCARAEQATSGADRFQQLDKNNDGKPGKDEIPAALYERLESDKDCFVTEEEAKALSKPRP